MGVTCEAVGQVMKLKELAMATLVGMGGDFFENAAPGKAGLGLKYVPHDCADALGLSYEAGGGYASNVEKAEGVGAVW